MDKKDYKPKKPTKKQMIENIAKTHENELKKNYVKALSQGYKMALNDILELSKKDEDFNVKEYCEKQLGLRENMEEVMDRMYDKKGEDI